MLVLSTNPTTVFGGTTITGDPSLFNGDAVIGFSYPWTLINYGALQGNGLTPYGVQLGDGGKVVNGAIGSVVGSISGGFDGVVIFGRAGTLVNQGTILATGTDSEGAYFGAGGTVINGASGATTALISGGYVGVDIVGGPGPSPILAGSRSELAPVLPRLPAFCYTKVARSRTMA
jgi:hypothetical protein